MLQSQLGCVMTGKKQLEAVFSRVQLLSLADKHLSSHGVCL